MGRFLLGFVIGVAIGAAAVIFTSPRSGSAIRQVSAIRSEDALGCRPPGQRGPRTRAMGRVPRPPRQKG